MTPVPERHWVPGSVYLTGYTRAQAIASVGPGWAELAARAWDAATRRDSIVVQVKEKMGVLIVYVRSADYATWDAVHRALNAVEDESLRVCEACGQPGQWRGEEYRLSLAATLGRRVRRWFKSLCDPCAWRYYAQDAHGWEAIRGEWRPGVDDGDEDDNEEVWR